MPKVLVTVQGLKPNHYINGTIQSQITNSCGAKQFESYDSAKLWYKENHSTLPTHHNYEILRMDEVAVWKDHLMSSTCPEMSVINTDGYMIPERSYWVIKLIKKEEAFV